MTCWCASLPSGKKGADGAVFSNKGGACYFFHGNHPAKDDQDWKATAGCFWFMDQSDKIVFAEGTPEDCSNTIVTREQFELARKHLITWAGSGLPPIGALVEDRSDIGGPIYMAEVVATEEPLVAIKRPGSLKVVDVYALRPVRTPSQIEAEARREAAAIDLYESMIPESHRIPWGDNQYKDDFYRAIDAGWRKQE